METPEFLSMSHLFPMVHFPSMDAIVVIIYTNTPILIVSLQLHKCLLPISTLFEKDGIVPNFFIVNLRAISDHFQVLIMEVLQISFFLVPPS